jgi:tetratricopeptide (TPR) repeat protein
MEYYKKAVDINPRFAPAANNLAWLYTEHGGNIDVALALAQTAKEQLPDNPAISDTLGWIYYKKNIYSKAIDLFKESLTQLDNNPEIHYHLGMAYYKNGNLELAKKELQESLKLDPNHPGASESQRVLAEIQ